MTIARDLPLAPPVLADVEARPAAATTAPTAVEARGVCFAYPGGFALEDVSLSVVEGSMCMILGPSGSGKSTFLKLVKGQLAPQRGVLSVLGAASAAARAAGGRSIAWIPQTLGLVRTMTVLENTLAGALGRMRTIPSLLKLFPADLREEAEAHLATLGIAHKIEEKVFNLSGGQRQRVAIARALMQQPRLVLADEFVSQLDPVTTRDTLDIVRRIADGGVTFLITSHEVELVAEYGDRAVFFRDGRKVLECAACDVDRQSAARAMGR